MTARAIVIGINEYPGTTRQKPLRGAVADAIDFARWAIDPHGGQVAADNLYFWGFPQPAAMPVGMERYVTAARPWPLAARPNFNDPPGSQPVTMALEAAADLAADTTDATGTQERLYVFMAGHGAMTRRRGHTRDPQNCLLTAEFVPNKAYGLIPLDDMRRMLEIRGPRETLIFCDCCRGELPLTVPDPVLNLPEYDDRALNEQWIIGHAAAPKAIAYEVPEAGPTRGAFTKLLVQGLRQYRIDGQLTLPELRGFVRNGVKQAVTPRIQASKFYVKDDDEDEPFVVAAGPPIGDLPALNVAFPPEIDGDVRLLDRDGKELQAALPITDGGLSLTLPPGQYIISHQGSGRERPVFHFGPEATHVDF